MNKADEDAIQTMLEMLAGVDTHDTDLRDAKKAWDAAEALFAHAFAAGMKQARADVAGKIDALASSVRIGL
jgi:hypothetical protein